MIKEIGNNFSFQKPNSEANEITKTRAERLNELAPRVYQRAFNEFGTKITGESSMCLAANPAGQMVLREEGINTEYKTLKFGELPVHAFLLIPGDDKPNSTLVDYQYKMFVPRGQREELPDCLVIDFTSKEDLLNGLREHRILPSKYHRWTEALFVDTIDTNLLNKDPLMDNEAMQQVGVQAIKDAQDLVNDPTRTVTSSTKYPTLVNKQAAELLQLQGFQTEYLAHDYQGTVTHAFIRIKQGFKKRLVDFQYKQFAPTTYYDQLPDYLDIAYSNRDEVIKGLERYHIPSDLHWHWLDELFWDN